MVKSQSCICSIPFTTAKKRSLEEAFTTISSKASQTRERPCLPCPPYKILWQVRRVAAFSREQRELQPRVVTSYPTSISEF